MFWCHRYFAYFVSGIQTCLFVCKSETSNMSWDQSFDRCKSAGLELAVFIDDNMTKKTLKQLSLHLNKINTDYAWVGGKAVNSS